MKKYIALISVLSFMLIFQAININAETVFPTPTDEPLVGGEVIEAEFPDIVESGKTLIIIDKETGEKIEIDTNGIYKDLFKAIKEKNIEEINVLYESTGLKEKFSSQNLTKEDEYIISMLEEVEGFSFISREDVYDREIITDGIDELLDIYFKGDADGDGKVTARDSAIVLNYVLRGDDILPYEQEAMDIDDNGDITAFDAAQILAKCLNNNG